MLFNTATTPARPKAIAALERDLEAMRKRRDTLTTKLDRATLAAERAASERRRMLIEVDEPSASDLSKAEAACRAANESQAGLEDAVRNAAERVRDLETNIAEQTDRASRDAAASELEKRALDVDISAGALRDALGIVAERYRALIETMRASGPITGSHGLAVAAELAALSVLDAGVRKIEPEIAPRRRIPSEPQAPTDVLVTAQEIVSSPLRRRAAAIRDGSVPANGVA